MKLWHNLRSSAASYENGGLVNSFGRNYFFAAVEAAPPWLRQMAEMLWLTLLWDGGFGGTCLRAPLAGLQLLSLLFSVARLAKVFHCGKGAKGFRRRWNGFN